MTLPLPRTHAPMEALLVDELPVGNEWRYEPKWDGFRCLAFRDGKRVDLMSKAEKPLAWSAARSSEWESLAPKLVVEVKYDHFSGGRFPTGHRSSAGGQTRGRHSARSSRWSGRTVGDEVLY